MESQTTPPADLRSRDGKPLRILFVASRDSQHPVAAGGERLLQLLAEELAARGHAVSFWSAGHASLPRRETHRGVRVERIGRTRFFAPFVWVRFVLLPRGHFDVVIEEGMGGERVPFLAVFLFRGPTVGALFQDHRPLIRTMYGGSSLVVRTGLMLQKVLLWAYQDGPLLTCSKATRDWLVSEGVPGARVGVIYPRVRLPPGVLARPWSERENAIVSIGNFRPTKRFEEAIEVVGRLRQEVPSATLHLVGRPYHQEYLSHLERRAAAAELQGAVRFHLSATEEEKYSLLARAKALVVHSPVEGFGWTIPEAGLVGTPTVANPGVPKDALDPGVSGEVVPFGDVAEYVRVLSRWMCSEEAWRPFSEGARHSAQRFTAPVLRPGMEAWLNEQLRRR
ncbi:MAG: glycosyltransferase family 4 protein [Euryarchaeota archaeon]|nr:glycosyltransferase family 4 protein [Euryarchaeota archaeon]MDE1881677.1 glycosyltransferase family 4 protein [Euryarchaeota archaeon]